LDRQTQALEARQRDLEQWQQRRDQQLEEQAARVVAREHELTRQQQEDAIRREQWSHDRRALHAELRRLRAQLRKALA
jgi:hypothetical protein